MQKKVIIVITLCVGLAFLITANPKLPTLSSKIHTNEGVIEPIQADRANTNAIAMLLYEIPKTI